MGVTYFFLHTLHGLHSKEMCWENWNFLLRYVSHTSRTEMIGAVSLSFL